MSFAHGVRTFSTENKQNEEPVEIEIEMPPIKPVVSGGETKEFKAETRKLLDIVAKSIYTDKEVFLRELLSNCSDALEKQRFNITSGKSAAGEDLFISITTNTKDRTITIFDSGIGMDKDQICENLGTIARSGSQEFLKNIEGEESSATDGIIGQFGVGFYSSFVVSDDVEVISKMGENV